VPYDWWDLAIEYLIQRGILWGDIAETEQSTMSFYDIHRHISHVIPRHIWDRLMKIIRLYNALKPFAEIAGADVLFSIIRALQPILDRDASMVMSQLLCPGESTVIDDTLREAGIEDRHIELFRRRSLLFSDVGLIRRAYFVVAAYSSAGAVIHFSLPMEVTSSNSWDNVPEDCPICLNPLGSVESVCKLSPCGHYLCMECLCRISCTPQAPRCPLCRGDIISFESSPPKRQRT
jgi:hypothetical protein